MKVLFLAGGFAKRLWPLTLETPKPLLSVGDKVIIEYTLIPILQIFDKKDVYITTNLKFKKMFERFLEKKGYSVKLIEEPTRMNGHKLGSIGAIYYFVEREFVRDDLMIIAADNITNLNFVKFIDFFRKRGNSVLAAYDINSKEDAKMYGVIEIDVNNRIVGFEEKPINPKSSLISTGCYILCEKDVNLIKDYLKNRNNPDTMGYFVKWLVKKSVFYAFIFKGVWFDIGSFDMLERARKFFGN